MSSITDAVPKVIYPQGVGLLATSLLFFGNIGLSLCGPVPIIKDEIGTTYLTTKSRVRVWKVFFDKAAVRIPRSTIHTYYCIVTLIFTIVLCCPRHCPRGSSACISPMAYRIARSQKPLYYFRYM